MNRTLRVRTGVRLHFGMFSFGCPNVPQFGGVGMMVDPPRVQVLVRPATRFSAEGPLASRVEAVANACCSYWDIDLPACQVLVSETPDAHIGLGAGTQLSLAVATGLARLLDRSFNNPTELAAAAGRGLRSAVGTYGFVHGGLIVDAGKQPHDVLGALAERRSVPKHWRVVLVRPDDGEGLAGQLEAEAFARLPTVSKELTDQLWQVTRSRMLPALAREDVQEFGEAVYRFGALAGSAFAAVQGGAFGSPRAAELVSAIRQFGVTGAGQSSWGPTLFAICGNAGQSEELVDWLAAHQGVRKQDMRIACPSNEGAVVDVEPGEA